MPCSHKRIWEKIEACDYFDDIDALLDEGWEPYQEKEIDDPNGFTTYTVVYFKRQKPCEECPKELQIQQETLQQLYKEDAERKKKYQADADRMNWKYYSKNNTGV